MQVVINIAHHGYPNGPEKAPVYFAAGETVDVPDAYAADIIAKNLAHEDVAPQPEPQVSHEAE